MAEKKEYREVWDRFMDRVKKVGKLSATAADLWLSEFRIEGITGSDVYLVCGSDLKRDFVEEKYSEYVGEVLSDILGIDASPKFFSDEKKPFVIPSEPGKKSKSRKERASFPEKILTEYDPSVSIEEDISIPLISNGYTFENFIEGPSNSLARAACLYVTENPGKQYNPLFIYGPSGIGKTHLLWAMINKIRAEKPDMKIIYVKGDDFLNQLIDCIRLGNQTKFQAKYRKADILLLDDIQFIAGKVLAQEEFFNTFNELYSDGKQIVMTSDRPPRDIRNLEERLRSRFEWGLIADIQPPEYELRLTIMNNKAAAMGVDIPSDVLELVAGSLKSNVRQLEGAIKKLSAQSFLTGMPITKDMAMSCIADLYVTGESSADTVDRIIGAVCKHTGISADKIKGAGRSADVSHARQLCIYLIKELTDMSVQAIGRELGRKHSTILYALNEVNDEKKANPTFATGVDMLAEKIKGSSASN